MQNFKPLLTIPQVSKILVISTGTIYNRLSQGTFFLKPIHIGKRSVRFDPDDLDNFLKSEQGKD